MNFEILAPVAAFITALISFVSLVLSKEQKTSEFRQAWIDGLREELADFFSTTRALCRAFEEYRNLSTADDHLKFFRFSQEKISEMRLLAADSLYKIKLRLNKSEAEHSELARMLDNAIRIQNRINLEKGTDYSEAYQAIDAAAEYSRDILKSEWERVKKGERPYQLTRNWLFPTIIVLCLLAIGTMLYTNERLNNGLHSTPGAAASSASKL